MSHKEKESFDDVVSLNDIKRKEEVKKRAVDVLKGEIGYWEYLLESDKVIWTDEVYDIFEVERSRFDHTFEGFLNLIYQKDRASFEKVYEESIREKAQFGPVMHRIITRSGEIKFIEEQGYTEFDESFEPVRSFGIVRDVTRQAEIEQKLLDEKRYVDSIVRSYPDAIFVLSKRGIFQDARARDKNIFLVQPNSFLGEHYARVLPRDVTLQFDCAIKKLTASSESDSVISIDYEINKGGKTHYYEARLTRMGNINIMVIVRDTSKQNEVLQKYQRLSDLQNLLVNISSLYITVEESSLESAINKSLAELGAFVKADRFYVFDYDFEQMTASNTYEWCAGGVEPQINELQDIPVDDMSDWIDNHRNGRMMIHDNVQKLPADSQVRLILEPQGIKSIITMPLMDKGGCTGFIGLDYVRGYHSFSQQEKQLLQVFSRMLINVNNRIEAQANLVENRQLLDDIINHSGSLIVRKNLNGAYELVNSKWEEVTGLSEKEVLGKTDEELFPVKTARQFMINDQKVIQRGEIIEAEEYLEDEEGVRYFISSKFPVRDKEGHINGMCGMFSEITDRKRAEEAEIKRRKSEAANQAKSEFLSGISHEIRTPLNAILGYAEILGQSKRLTKKQHRQISTIQKSSDYLLTLINGILDISKIEAGNMGVDTEKFSPSDLYLYLYMMFSQKAKQKKIRFRLNADKDHPEYVLGDVSKIRQVLINILGNALKFTDEGEVSLYAELFKNPGTEINNKQDYLFKFIISDSGPGIASDEIPNIFNSFYQLETGKKTGGSGLGLAISNKLTSIMGGTISVESTVGAGTTFTVIIPVNSDEKFDQSKKQLQSDENSTNKGYTADTMEPEKLSVMLPKISPDQIRKLEQAVLDGDMKKLRLLTNRLTDKNDFLENEIKTLAAQYDYEKLLILFEELRNA